MNDFVADVLNTQKPRIIQWIAGPVSILAGAVAVWLTTHLHFLATFHIDQGDISGAIAQTVIFAVSSFLTYLPQHNWVKGHQVELAKAWEILKEIQATPVPQVGQNKVSKPLDG